MLPDPSPGEMGWGENLITDAKRLEEEQRAFDLLAESLTKIE
jgi:hypothetical protein